MADSHPLVKKWTVRLYKEFEAICYSRRLSLLSPVIYVIPPDKNIKSYWAQWDVRSRSISINGFLLIQYSWPIVRQVLAHEMAHQLVSEKFSKSAGSEAPHGLYFQQACEALGVEKWARSASIGACTLDEIEKRDQKAGLPPLNHFLEGSSGNSPEEVALMRRVEKLLALATSSNEHEALAAMAKVKELSDRHGFETLKQGKEDFATAVIFLKKKRTEAFHTFLSSIMTSFYHVTVIHSHAYDVHDDADYNTIELLGLRQNVKMAEYVYYFLMRQVESLWKAQKSQYKGMRNARRSFMSGVLQGFFEKLQKLELEKNRTPTSERHDEGFENSLIPLKALEGQKREEYVRWRFPRISVTRSYSSSVLGTAYQSGKTEGKKIVISKGVETGQSRFSGYIGSR